MSTPLCKSEAGVLWDEPVLTVSTPWVVPVSGHMFGANHVIGSRN